MLASELKMLCSDLHWEDKEVLIRTMLRFNIQDYSLKEWNDAFVYLFEMKNPVKDISEVKTFLKDSQVKKKKDIITYKTQR